MKRMIFNLFIFTLGAAFGAVLADRINQSRITKVAETTERRTYK